MMFFSILGPHVFACRHDAQSTRISHTMAFFILFSLTVLITKTAEGKSVNLTVLPVANDAPYTVLQGGEVCDNFTNGTNMEFYSPLYPYNYPQETDCIKLISAGPGQVIRIKFLDHFYIEGDESCTYDFLEVRDGQFGYSSLIQKICGTTPPSFLQSSGRHLWLRFHSDKDIQYIGFRAVFEYLPSLVFRPDLDDCSLTLSTIEGHINTKDLSEEMIANRRNYGIPIDCTWIIQAEEGRKIYLQFQEYKLEKHNDCTFNYIEVYGSRTELEGPEGRIKQFCGSETDSVTSVGNIMHLRFYTMYEHIDKPLKSFFEAFYTIIRETQTCTNDEFDCTDGTCIDKSLICNERANCKLRNDEDEKCGKMKQTFQMSTDIIIIAFLGCLLIAGMCSGMFLNIYRKLRQDKLELQELREALRKSQASIPPALQLQKLQQRQQPPEEEPEISPTLSSQNSGESKDTVIERKPDIPYSPPPPYPKTVKESPKLQGKDRSPEKEKEKERVVEVRDSACQTREWGGKRAPLAREDALEISPVQKTSADLIVYPS